MALEIRYFNGKYITEKLFLSYNINILVEKVELT